MIVYKKGDIVKALKDGDISILAHGCNCSGGFGSGVAGAIAREWPDVKKEFLKLPNILHPGLVYKDPKINIVHAFTQQHYGRGGKQYVDYNAIKTCMETIAKVYYAVGEPIGIPKIGSGLGGGDWNIIEKIIEKAFFGREIWIYEL